MFKADPDVLRGCGIQSGISCNVPKLLPWNALLAHGVCLPYIHYTILDYSKAHIYLCPLFELIALT